MIPKTPKQVCSRLMKRGWHPSVVFDNGASDCRNLNATLIRESLPLLRRHAAAGKDVRALVAYIRAGDPPEIVEASWRTAIDALLALFRTSPIGMHIPG